MCDNVKREAHSDCVPSRIEGDIFVFLPFDPAAMVGSPQRKV